MIYKVLLLLLIFVFELSASEKSKKNENYITLEHKVACAATEKDAILKVDEVLKKVTGINSKHLYSKNLYIRHRKNSKGMACVEGVVTQEGFDLYVAELAEQYEFIMGEIEDLDDGISYTKKSSEVAALYKEVQIFNKKLATAKKMAPVSIEKIDESEVSLSKMINAIPVVRFHVKGCRGKYVTGCKLVYISSFKDDSSKIKYQWDFGDGATSKHKNPIHSYKHPGRFKVSLRVTDAGEKHNEVSKIIKIRAKPKPRVKYKPVASFTSSSEVYVMDETIVFHDTSKSKNSKIVSRHWDFGDKEASVQHEPIHSYHKSGHYKVKLEVTNSDGLKDSSERSYFIVHPVLKYAIDGRKYNRIVRKFGQPKKSIVKPGVLTRAYQYGNDWLLVKQNKVKCRVKGNAFKTNLMGNPKNCRWYEKHIPSALYTFDK